MLHPKTQRTFLKKRISKILRHLNAYSKTRNAEELHQLRVEIKTVNALIHLVDRCLKRSRLKTHLVILKQIFEHAAKIRNAHIALKLTAGVTGKKFRSEQNSIQLGEWKKFVWALKGYDKEVKALKDELLPLLKPVKNKQIEKWYKHELKKAAEFLDETGQYHNSRKRLKRLLYMIDLCPPNHALNKLYIEQLEDAIGKWHDATAVINLLKRKKAFKGAAAKKLKPEAAELKFLVVQLAKDFNKRVAA